MVCKLKFIRYGHRGTKFALYVPWFDFGGSPKSKMSHFQIANLDFWYMDPKFHLALELKVLNLGGSFFGIRLSFYVLMMIQWNPSKSAHNSDI